MRKQKEQKRTVQLPPFTLTKEQYQLFEEARMKEAEANGVIPSKVEMFRRMLSNWTGQPIA